MQRWQLLQGVRAATGEVLWPATCPAEKASERVLWQKTLAFHRVLKPPKASDFAPVCCSRSRLSVRLASYKHLSKWWQGVSGMSSSRRRLLAYTQRCISKGGTTPCGVVGLAALTGSNETRLICEYNKLSAVASTEFYHRTAHVRLGGRRADDKPFGDFIIGQTASH
jgi:hypothetical protein